jgi:hypothetical protein
MSIKSKFLTKTLAVLLIAAFFTSTAIAGEYNGYGDEWQHSITVYGWGAGLGGRTASGSGIDVGFDTILDNLDFAFMGNYKAHKDRWSFLADFIYMDLSAEKQLDLVPPIGGDNINVTTDSNAGVEGRIFQMAGGYNLHNRESTTVDFVFGARYLDLSADLLFAFDLGLPEVNPTLELSESNNNWDAFIGLNGKIRIGARWFIPYHVDVGAGDSDLTWQALAGVAYNASDWADITLVYRFMAWDIGGELVDDINFSGPALGVVFKF